MRVLITPMTSSSVAHTVRGLALADELIKRGHEVAFTSCEFRKDFIEKNGYKVVKSYPHVNFGNSENQTVNFLVEFKEDIKAWFQAEIDATKEYKPDIVVTASGVLGPHTYFATGVPIVSIIDSQYLDESIGLMGLSMAHNNLKSNIITGILRPLFNKTFIKLYLSKILAIYKDLNLPQDLKTRADLYKPYHYIIPADTVLEPTKRSPKIHHVGPLIWDGFENMDTDLTDEFITKFKNGKKLIYIYFGGSVFRKEIYDKVLNSLEQLDHKIIVCFGPNWHREDFPEDDSQTLYRQIVPNMRLSKHADIIINTGAQGGVSQALMFGKPQILIPTIMDQSFFANRVEELGAGINVNKIPLTKFSKRESFAIIPSDLSDRIIKAVNKILKDESYSIAAQKHSRILNSYKNAAAKSVEIIENLI